MYKITAAFLLFFFLFPSVTLGQDFSCSYGKRGACLDYGDKVCSSYDKCVDGDAVCFDRLTCFGNFICKSKYDDLANEYSTLSDEYNALLNKCKTVAGDYDNLVNEYNDLLRKKKNWEFCLSMADSLNAAQNCLW